MKRTVNLSIISILTTVGCVGMTSIAQARDIPQSFGTSLPETTILAQGGGGPRLPIPQGPQNPNQDAAVRGQITQLYRLILNRAPDDFGMNYYLGRYYNGMTIDQIRQELSNSDEARRARNDAISRSNNERDQRYNSDRYDNRYSQDNVRSQINSIYRRILNRNADNFGMNYYLERYNNDGWSLDRISQHIWDSDEARDLRGW
jgi:hypothetical protein